jgi:hypothetical protein
MQCGEIQEEILKEGVTYKSRPLRGVGLGAKQSMRAPP